MAYSYNTNDLSITTSAGRLNVVRLLIGDTNELDQQLQNEEILFSLSQSGDNVYYAGSFCARLLASKYARMVDTQLDGALEATYSDRVKHYNLLAIQLSDMGKKYGGRSLGVLAGGISVTEINTVESNTDRPSPAFKVDQFKNEG